MSKDSSGIQLLINNNPYLSIIISISSEWLHWLKKKKKIMPTLYSKCVADGSNLFKRRTFINPGCQIKN